MSELKQAWEYSFIHSSATGRGDEEIGPCLTYEKSVAFGKGCIKQREVFVSTQPEATKDDSLRTSLADLAMALWRTHYRNDSPNFELLPDAAGILSQIDNMVSGLVKPEATKPAQDLGAAILALPLPGASAASTFGAEEHVYSAWQMRDILRVAAELAKNHECTDAMTLAQENFELQKALVFWLPQVNPLMKKEMADRIAKDAYLLIMDGNLPDDFKTAEELHWILVETDPELTGGDFYTALASPADALVAGDRVDAELFERLFNEYMTVLSSAYCQCDLDEKLVEQCITAIQAQKDGHD